MPEDMSPLQKERIRYEVKLPASLKQLSALHPLEKETLAPKSHVEELKELFGHVFEKPFLKFVKGKELGPHPVKNVGVVLSGGQAAGGHNVIIGLYDALTRLNPHSRLFGFLNGPRGLFEGNFRELGAAELEKYRNQGGFDMIGSGRDKIETLEQFAATEKYVLDLELDGLVIIGGDDSNTNAALIAEYFASRNITCAVVGVPKTIDGDMKGEWVEASFGFDTACKRFSESIGDIARDAISAKKYYFFIKLMGRSASHITLECALQTHPNIALIGEEVRENKSTLRQIVCQIADIIVKRSEEGKNYGVILVPEGVIEFIPEIEKLIKELNHLLAEDKSVLEKLNELNFHEAKSDFIARRLSDDTEACFLSLPHLIQMQMLKERDPHGNVQVSKIETERLLIEMVKDELKKRKEEGSYQGKFGAQPLFFGYEGRSSMPSNFDANYCYALGQVAALLVNDGRTSYMAAIANLSAHIEDWEPIAVPLVSMMAMEERKGKVKPVIEKALVDLSGEPFRTFQKERDVWKIDDDYRYPGPIQYFGPAEITDNITQTLRLERSQAIR